MDRNENMQEKISSIATMEVNSSMMLASALFAIRREVMTIRQKPRRFAAVFRMCWEVLFDI